MRSPTNGSLKRAERGTAEAPAMRAEHLSKRFGGVLALDDVSLSVRPGERLAVVGENGAGKSTLMRIVAGILAADAGRVEVMGTTLEHGPQSAIAAGVALVHQELSLVPELSVAENISLGAAPVKFGFVKRHQQRDFAAAALDEIGVKLDVDEHVGRLSVASRQFVEIARAVSRRPRLLILDEPTATLTPAETDHILELLGQLSEQGIALLYISHRLPEIFRLCSRATVLRDGKVVADLDLSQVSTSELIGKMVGRELAKDRLIHRDMKAGEVVLSARNVSAAKVNDVSLDVRAGQIVGIGGLVGAGRSELVRAIIGADPRTAGVVTIATPSGEVGLRSYRSAVRHGVAYVPEERRTEGLALTMTVSENIALPSRLEMSSGSVLNASRIKALALATSKDVGLNPDQPRREAGQFSGGNQQKVVIGKWLATKPRVVVLDEPTRGVDVGAKAQIHRLVRRLADDGAAVLMVSSDLPELLELSDVIHVVRDAHVVGSLEAKDANEQAVMSLAAGHDEEPS